jgi:hypothetical protein
MIELMCDPLSERAAILHSDPAPSPVLRIAVTPSAVPTNISSDGELDE